MTGSVRPPSQADQAWADLAAELTPANSLARIDTVTARAITTITVLGTLLTGLGTLAAGRLSSSGAVQDLAAATAITAALAVACALTAQVLTITRHLNPANLTEVRAWYRRQFGTRAYTTQAATLLLIAAALLAGVTAATNILTTTQAATRASSSATGKAAATRPATATPLASGLIHGTAPQLSQSQIPMAAQDCRHSLADSASPSSAPVTK